MFYYPKGSKLAQLDLFLKFKKAEFMRIDINVEYIKTDKTDVSLLFYNDQQQLVYEFNYNSISPIQLLFENHTGLNNVLELNLGTSCPMGKPLISYISSIPSVFPNINLSKYIKM